MSQVRVRRRATKACLGCRERKVRCDVVICGPPCTNCYLDGKSCIITQRMNKRRRPQSPDVLWDVSGSSFSPLRAKKTSNSPEHLERGVAGVSTAWTCRHIVGTRHFSLATVTRRAFEID
ncbi:cutinase transcription factor 1 beta [Fusarium fujikuroi]|nr:cutinase transcription factor 1 beta [Fusarium fujikuroi]